MIGELEAFWSKGQYEGGCCNCLRRTEHIAVVRLNDRRESVRFCPPCLEALIAVAESMAEDAPSTVEQESGL